MRIKTYVKPKTVKEAYDLLNEQSKNQIIGGGCWLKILPKQIETAIDLSHCQLEYIKEVKDYYEIGSYVNLSDVENNAALSTHFDGILGRSIGEVMGVPFRNIATIGGTVVGKYGFSDIITALLAMDTQLIFYDKGLMSLETYLINKEKNGDILMGLRIKKDLGKGYFYTLKKTANDFPIVNIAITKNKVGYKICIGARPGVAMLAKETMEYMNTVDEINDASLEKASTLLITEILLGTNMRGSKMYRQEVVKGLLCRGLKEVSK